MLDESGSTAEVLINFTIWSAAVFYSLYNFFISCQIFDNQPDIYNDFTPGWSIINRKKDSADEEWQTILYLLTSMAAWCLIHIIIGEIIRYKTADKSYSNTTNCSIQWFHLLLSTAFLIFNIHPKIILIILLQPIMFRFFYQYHHISLIWFCCMLCLILSTCYKFVNFSELIEGCSDKDYILSITGMFWMNLRCLSYFVDKLNNGKDLSVDNLEYFAYCFYLPLLFCGPFIGFQDYSKTIIVEQLSLSERAWKLIQNLGRIAFWILFTEFALHFIYVNPMAYQIEYVKTFDSWTIYGYGYAMGQFFHLKYVVLYGFSTAFAEFEGIPVPGRPKCIGRIHLYSDMWKFFDHGFYNFLIKYVYIPLTGIERTLTRQLLASFACFLFVYVWHGVETYILIWTIINLICIIIEKVFQLLMTTQVARHTILACDEKWKQRLHGILASPLLAVSAMANSYFFAGKTIGDVFFVKFFSSDICAKLTLFVLLYFCCQVSIHTRMWEKKKKTL